MSNRIFLRVNNITQQTTEAVSITFDNPENTRLDYKAGQFLTFIIQKDGKEIRRAYSLCSSPTTDELPAVAIKKVQNGNISQYMTTNVRIGDVLECLTPMGIFTTDFLADNHRHLVLFAGGSGITPMFSILKTALSIEKNTKISLIYANKDNENIIFKNELESLEKQYADRFKIITVLEKAPFFWNKGYKGYLDTAKIKKILDSLPKINIRDTEFMMCGPQPMMKVIENAFKELSLPLDKLKKENFSLSPEESAEGKAKIDTTITANDQEGFEVKVKYDGEEHTFKVPPQKTILEVALSLNIDLPFSCQSGMCTACLGRCVAGKVHLDEEDALTPKELAQGMILTCVGHPITDSVIIEID
ncbi:MAG: ferredoxin--NADP reductase [Cytophagales bacterium]|nr:MAG: ferredoxin--NADP reductase [Cytophagales bacterium]TAH28222.1 MAG: ferredoxin--NADP reductase [Cytophagales bacterium]